MKDKDLNLLIKCANKYEKKLNGKSMLVIYNDADKLMYLELYFKRGNFKHLTGVETDYSAKEFYKLLLRNKVNIRKIKKKKDGTTDLKLSVLSLLLEAETKIRYVGISPDNRINLQSDFYIGSERFCLGAVEVDNYYVPSTLLKSGVKDETSIYYHVQSIYVKSIGDESYTVQTYKNKNFDNYTVTDLRLKSLLNVV